MSGGSDRVLTRPFVFLWLATFFHFASFFLLMPVIPLYVQGMRASAAEVGIAVAAFTVSSLSLRPFIGKLVDRTGRRRFLIAGTIVFAVMAPLYGLAHSVLAVVLVRVIHGSGMALFTTASLTVATDLAPPHRRGQALAWFAMANSLAIGIGPALGAFLWEAGGTWAAFGAAAALSALGFTMAISVAVPPHQTHADDGPRRLRLVHPAAVAPALLIFSLALTYGCSTAFVSLFVKDRHLGNAGWFFMAYSAAILTLRPFAGALSDQRGRRYVLMPGLACAGLAVCGIGFAQTVPALLLLAAAYGLGVGAAQSTVIALTMDRVGTHGRGLGAATFLSALELGLALGASGSGLLLDATNTNYTVLFAVVGLAPLVGSVATRWVKEGELLAAPPAQEADQIESAVVITGE